MGGKLDEDELIQRWTIVDDELAQVAGKRGATRLGFALLLKFYEQHGRFPRARSELPGEAIAYVGRQVGVQAGELGSYELDGRTVEYHRAQIRSSLGFRECTVGDAEKLTAFLVEGVCQQERRAERVREALLCCSFAAGDSYLTDTPTLAARHEHLWGQATTTASDSTKLGAWDQNLLTEWHARYRGPGVMIYWHVERRSLCIYSQLKSCSSSEVASMIEGLLRHCSTMAIDGHYVDSHGQSEVGFAFCHLLGFRLLPRLKRIGAQRLYRPEPGPLDRWASLAPVLSRPINWELIGQQYDQMMRYATALRLGTADTEAILRRFTRTNVAHPTYRALAELGKAVKTLFLCEYLGSEQLRREVHEGLNVIESWNGVNGFIYFGKGGEITTNRHEDQELAVLCLHLLQACLVYINTLMIQEVLDDPTASIVLGPDDLRGLTPLTYSHVNPYGTFRLDMAERLSLSA